MSGYYQDDYNAQDNYNARRYGGNRDRNGQSRMSDRQNQNRQWNDNSQDFGHNRNESGSNSDYNSTGYGTTRYNNRDMDRERSASRNYSSGNRNNDEYTRSRYRDDYNREL